MPLLTVSDDSGIVAELPDATATAESPIVGDITYTVVVGGSTVANVTIHIDLGTLTAHAKYTSGA
jgi:hypothetical protein